MEPATSTKPAKVETGTARPLTQQGFAHVLAGFVLMGSWAAFANRAHGVETMVQAGLVQATITAVITLGMKKSIDAISAALRRAQRPAASLIVPPLAVCSVSLGLLTGLHTLAGTPELARTIVVPFSVSFLYACLYAFNLWRTKVKAPQ